MLPVFWMGMANKNEKAPENVPGPWYVDQQCIICGLCSEYAPKVFAMAPAGDHNYVFHQPETPEELAEAEQVRHDCPVDAIGNDGVP